MRILITAALVAAGVLVGAAVPPYPHSSAAC
jgi:hypothetical protein